MKSHFIPMLGLTMAILACKPSAPAAPPSEPIESPTAPEPGPVPMPMPMPVPVPVADPEDVHIAGDHLEIDRFIHFAFDSHQILEDSFDLLDHIAQLLKNHPEIVKLHVIGHTDSAGTREYNQQLSERRANSVVEALRSRGVTQTMDAAGKGMTQHLCTENTDACHEKNRRVEFVIEKR